MVFPNERESLSGEGRKTAGGKGRGKGEGGRGKGRVKKKKSVWWELVNLLIKKLIINNHFQTNLVNLTPKLTTQKQLS